MVDYKQLEGQRHSQSRTGPEQSLRILDFQRSCRRGGKSRGVKTLAHHEKRGATRKWIPFFGWVAAQMYIRPRIVNIITGNGSFRCLFRHLCLYSFQVEIWQIMARISVKFGHMTHSTSSLLRTRCQTYSLEPEIVLWKSVRIFSRISRLSALCLHRMTSIEVRSPVCSGTNRAIA